MPQYFPVTEGLTPGARLGASKTSSLLLDANERRERALIKVDHETAKVYFSLGPTAILGYGLPVTQADGILEIESTAEIAMVTETEGPDEKQEVTLEVGAEESEKEKEGKADTFTLEFDGEVTEGIAAEATNEELKEALEALSNIEEEDVVVAGEAGGPWTVTFEGTYKGVDVPLLVPDSSELVEADAVVTTKTPGGVPVCVMEM